MHTSSATGGQPGAVYIHTYMCMHACKSMHICMHVPQVGSLVLPRQVVEVTGGTIAFTDAECW